MPRIDRLPPPPAVPQRPPPVAVAGEVEVRVPGLAGGPSLDARMHAPAGPVRAVVLCHPHPLYGGSMNSPVPLSVAKALSELAQSDDRVAWLRFDFRGVGASAGAYDDGRGEVDDVLAAIATLVAAVGPGVPVTVCGHSFGSWVGLQAALRAPAVDRVLLLAPSVRFGARGERADGTVDGLTDGLTLPEAPNLVTTVFVGDRDDLCDVDEARALADSLGATLRVFEGFDHHFLKSRRAMAQAALPVIAPEVVSP